MNETLPSRHRIRNSNRGRARYFSVSEAPTILNLHGWAEKKHFASLKLECHSGVRTGDHRLSKQADLTTAQGPPLLPFSGRCNHDNPHPPPPSPLVPAQNNELCCRPNEITLYKLMPNSCNAYCIIHNHLCTWWHSMTSKTPAKGRITLPFQILHYLPPFRWVSWLSSLHFRILWIN